MVYYPNEQLPFVRKALICFRFLRLENTCDMYANHRFYHFMCGTTASANTPRDDNVFLFYENVGDDNFHLSVIRLLHKDGRLEFKEEKIR